MFTNQRLAGHADAVTTARYDRHGEGESRRAKGIFEFLRQDDDKSSSLAVELPPAPSQPSELGAGPATNRIVSKHDALRDLGTKRRLTCWVGYKGIGDFHNGIYECEFVSPYSKSAGNTEASVMVVLQDWSSEKKLAKPVDADATTLGYTRRLPTNRNLVALLRSHFELEFSEVFATNLFPFIKSGDMSEPIPEADLVRAATEFAIPQMEIVGSRIVICLGLATFNAIRVALGLERVSVLEEGIESPLWLGDAQVWCQAHTGYWGPINRNRGGINRVDQDWARMAREFRRRQ